MAYENEKLRPDTGHHVILEDREQLMISGVEEVESFDESAIFLTTAQGGLEIQGEGLHIEKLSLDGGDLKVEGTVNALIYESRGREQAVCMAAYSQMTIDTVQQVRLCARLWALGRCLGCCTTCSVF